MRVRSNLAGYDAQDCKLLVGVVVVAAKCVFDQILQDMMHKIVNYLLVLLWWLQNACSIKSCGI